MPSLEFCFVTFVYISSGVKENFNKLKFEYVLTCNSKGGVSASIRYANVRVWCSQQTYDWPNEYIHCPLIIKFRNHGDFIFSAKSYEATVNSTNEQFSINSQS